MNAVELGFAIGSIPTIAMLLASYLMYAYSFGKVVEGCIQYFAGGLILAIVATELFPLITEAESTTDMCLGVTIGFSLAFGALHGIEYLIEYFSESDENEVLEIYRNIEMKETVENILLPDQLKHSRTEVITTDGIELLENPTTSAGHWEQEGVIQATHAINQPKHRKHIIEHFYEVKELLQLMERKSNELIGTDMGIIEAELLAEQIDESVHQLQYKLDHCRRLLQGSESHKDNRIIDRKSWLTEEKKYSIQNEVKILNHLVDHLMDHLSPNHTIPHPHSFIKSLSSSQHGKDHGLLPSLDSSLLPITSESIQEIHDHLTDMDRHIHHFHDYIDRWTWKWKSKELVETTIGDTLPRSLIIPVVIDCFVDGFLIGVTIAISTRAGYILAGANCLEMSSLGMAYSSRITKCTGSSLLNRQLAVIIPPIIMFLSSGIGAALAAFADGVEIVFIIFVSFGIFALVSLICCELIIEAREVQETEGKWWMELFIFAGIYLTLILEPFL